jgi:pimeloyl-ACP methyl ester carboxylesterase
VAQKTLSRSGVHLVVEDFGGAGPSVLLLHGLAGHSLEWRETANRLIDSHRVLALDLRGHGASERRPLDVSLQAHVEDVAYLVEELELAPVVLVGHSMGGVIALLTAGRRPELVRALVIGDASAERPDQADVAVAKVQRALSRWPLPFASIEQATEFFGGPSSAGEAWILGLERRDDGLWPRFDLEVMVQTMREACSQDYWDDWDRLRCPTLVVRASRGMIPREHLQAMGERLPSVRFAEIEGASHDLHLDRPREWLEALTVFLNATDPRIPPAPSGDPQSPRPAG